MSNDYDTLKDIFGKSTDEVVDEVGKPEDEIKEETIEDALNIAINAMREAEYYIAGGSNSLARSEITDALVRIGRIYQQKAVEEDEPRDPNIVVFECSQ